MLFHSRHRRGVYPLATVSVVPSVVKWGVATILTLLLLYIVGSSILRFFGVGNPIRRTATALHVEGRGTVNVTLEGGALQRAQDGMKLYPGDRIQTGGGANATLVFFDGTVARLDQQSDCTIGESALGSVESALRLELESGTVWIAAARRTTYSGAIIRTVHTPVMVFMLPSETEAMFAPLKASVYAAEGLGVEITLQNLHRASIFLGEGQQLNLPSPTELGSDLYVYRSPLDPLVARSAFVEESRIRRSLLAKSAAKAVSSKGSSEPITGFLSVTSPGQGAVLRSGTVKVAGSFAEGVLTVKVNEYKAVLDSETHTFTQELALPPGKEDFDVQITALDAQGNVLEELRRSVKQEIKAPDAPVITVPAKQGETYRTQKEEFVLRGRSPARAVGILVNDYRLQLFSPTKGEWSYLASARLGNYKPGVNTFSVIAIDAAGTKSEPAVLTVLLEEGQEGVVRSIVSSANGSSLAAIDLPNNDPLTPGMLSVSGPTPGTSHTATGSEFLIEGATSSETASIWVGDYRLQLYVPGKTFWNYIASVALQTMKVGTNVYTVVARNAEGKILDRITYTVTYHP